MKSTSRSYEKAYHVASACRSKLGLEARREDRNLQRLVCHANMLDRLMRILEDWQEGWEDPSEKSLDDDSATSRVTKLPGVNGYQGSSDNEDFAAAVLDALDLNDDWKLP